MNRPGISLCMIVRNEERFIAQCLKSIMPVVDEMVIMDTGSSDNTPGIARELGARVLNHTWKGDFSEARNEVLEHASFEWILSLDADELISPLDHDQLRSLPTEGGYDGFMLAQRTYSNSVTDLWRPNSGEYPEAKGFAGYDELPVIRLFRNRPDIRFQGNIHETVRFLDGTELRHRKTGIPIHHFGKTRSPEEIARKCQRYLDMNLTKLESGRTDAKAHFELGRQYSECEKHEEAIAEFKAALAIDPAMPVAKFDLAIALWKSGRLDEAARTLENVVAEDPSANAFSMLGIVLMQMERDIEALAAFEKSLSSNPDFVPAYNNIGKIHSARNRHGKSIPFFKKALEKNPNYIQAIGNLAVAYEHAADWPNALDTYARLLAKEPRSAAFVETRVRAIEQCMYKTE